MKIPYRKLAHPCPTKRHLSPCIRPLDGDGVGYTITMRESKKKKMKLGGTTHRISGYGIATPRGREMSKPGWTRAAHINPRKTIRTLACGNPQTKSTWCNEPTANPVAKTQALPDDAHATTMQMEQTKHISTLSNKWGAFCHFSKELRVFQQPLAVIQGTIGNL